MMKNTVSVRVDAEDIEKLMNDGVTLLLKEHPEFKGMNLSKKFMFKRAVNFYLKE